MIIPKGKNTRTTIRPAHVICLFLAIGLLLSTFTFAECPQQLPTETNNQDSPNCLNIHFDSAPPKEVDPAVTHELELSITAGNSAPYHSALDMTDGSGFSLHASVTSGTTDTLYISETHAEQ